MTPTGNRLRNHRATFALAVCAGLLLASALPLTVASCRTQTAPKDDAAAYERLREDIDRSRQMYDKRVRPEVSSRYDYFDHELVNMLAEGDRNKLGADYPGATVNA